MALLVALTASVCLGSTQVPLADVWSAVRRGLSGSAPAPGTRDLIVWQLRVPRALLAAVVGAGLGLVGTAVQALVRNPLADPYLLGISSGASLGAVAAIVLGGGRRRAAGARAVLGRVRRSAGLLRTGVDGGPTRGAASRRCGWCSPGWVSGSSCRASPTTWCCKLATNSRRTARCSG
ncbi:hypothetical protein GCM10020000_68180 [Streptomyces olivoverticillatus]